MNSLLINLFVALIGALLCWSCAKYYNRSRLYCSPSRLYEYSSLITGSSTVQLVIANRGRKTEEAVEVQLSTDYEYHVLAATQNGVEILKEKVIRLPILLPNSEVSLVVVAEGKPRFTTDGIRSIRSKNSEGSITANLSEAEATSPAVAASAALSILIFAIFGYGFGKTIGEDLWSWAENQMQPIVSHNFREGCVSFISNAGISSRRSAPTEEQLKKFAIASVHVKQVTSRGDVLFVETEIDNLIEGPIEHSLSLKSHASDSNTDIKHRRNSHIYDIVLLEEKEKRKYLLSNFFPQDRKPKRFWIESRMEIDGIWISATRSFFFGSDASMTCSANT